MNFVILLIKTKKLSYFRLVDVNMLVVDELDRLLVDDFEDQTKHILSGVSVNNLSFSLLLPSIYLQ